MKFAIASCMAMMSCLALGQVAIKVDGEQIDTGEAGATITKGRVMIPMRAVFEKLGATVSWVPSKAMVLIEKGTQVTRLWVGEQKAQINQETATMDVAPTNVNGVVRVPLRFISEALGSHVMWDSATRTVTINSGSR